MAPSKNKYQTLSFHVDGFIDGNGLIRHDSDNSDNSSSNINNNNININNRDHGQKGGEPNQKQ